MGDLDFSKFCSSLVHPLVLKKKVLTHQFLWSPGHKKINLAQYNLRATGFSIIDIHNVDEPDNFKEELRFSVIALGEVTKA